MKISSVGTLIVSPKKEEYLKLFKELGFEEEHVKSDIEGGANVNTVLKDAKGNRIDISSTQKLDKDLTSLRINVDNFEEALEYFTKNGFVNTRGDKITETSSSTDTFLISPTGLGITLAQHKVDNNQTDKLKELEKDPRTLKQVEKMVGIINDAFRNNMDKYVKLIQMDAMKEFDTYCEKDGVKGERVEFSKGILDEIMKQVNKDLEKQKMGLGASLKKERNKLSDVNTAV